VTTLIAWCGFAGSWLLVAGPLDQAIRDLREEDFERAAVDQASRRVDEPPPVSRRWVLLPPVYLVLLHRRSIAYRNLIAQEMSTEDFASLAHMREVASAWMYVAAGAFLIAVSATWQLQETYGWPRWTFWATVGVMIGLIAVRTTLRVLRPAVPRREPPRDRE
jgi:hypothetical protein